MTAQKDYSNFGKTGGQFNMYKTSFDYTPLEELKIFIHDLFTIVYFEEELPENEGRVFGSPEEWSYRDMKEYLPGVWEREIYIDSELKDLKNTFWEEKFSNNNSFIENSVILIRSVLNEINSQSFTVGSHENAESASEEYVKELRELAEKKLIELQEFAKSLLATHETKIQPTADEPDFDNSISVEPNSDTRKVLFLWQLDIIDHLQRMGYSNNEIGRIIMDMFELPDNKKKNRRINIGSLISKIQNKNNPSDSPLNSDAGIDYIDELEKKYKIQSRKKQ